MTLVPATAFLVLSVCISFLHVVSVETMALGPLPSWIRQLPSRLVYVHSPFGNLSCRSDMLSVVSCLGIRYASPPVGGMRWRPPIPVSLLGSMNNSHVTETTFFGACCTEEEDCLSMNVFSPVGKHPPLPVMVWVHGGGYMFGCSKFFDGASLVAAATRLGQPVLVVSFNYRIGALGFLGGAQLKGRDVHSPRATGNWGIEDQRLALRWVARYIWQFGGDPSRVTLFGESAGAASVSNHLVSPRSADLFHAAIMQSGAFARWSAMPAAVAQAQYDWFERSLGCEAHGAACLEKASFGQIMFASNRAQPAWFGLPWVPVADGAVLPDEPYFAVMARQGARESHARARTPTQPGSEKGAHPRATDERISELVFSPYPPPPRPSPPPPSPPPVSAKVSLKIYLQGMQQRGQPQRPLDQQWQQWQQLQQLRQSQQLQQRQQRPAHHDMRGPSIQPAEQFPKAAPHPQFAAAHARPRLAAERVSYHSPAGVQAHRTPPAVVADRGRELKELHHAMGMKPILMGSNSDEFAPSMSSHGNLRRCCANNMPHNMSVGAFKEFAAGSFWKEWVLDGEADDAAGAAAAAAFMDVATARSPWWAARKLHASFNFICPTSLVARTVEPWLYRFDASLHPEKPFHGAAHGDDQDFVFGTDNARRVGPDLSDVIIRYWTAFATHLDPNGPAHARGDAAQSSDAHSARRSGAKTDDASGRMASVALPYWPKHSHPDGLQMRLSLGGVAVEGDAEAHHCDALRKLLDTRLPLRSAPAVNPSMWSETSRVLRTKP